MSLETLLFTAQSNDNLAGGLTSQGSQRSYFPGAAALLGISSGPKFNPNAFVLYPKWVRVSGANPAARQSIARGEMLFDNHPMRISAVPGFNDVQGNSVGFRRQQ